MKKSFTILLLFAVNCLSAQFTNVMIDNSFGPNEPSITINPLNTSVMAAGSNFENYYYSTDAGATWTTGLLSSTFGQQGDPCLVADSSGNLFYVHLAGSLDRVVCQKSSDGGVSYNNGSFAWNNNALLQDKSWACTDPQNGNIYLTWSQYDNGWNPGPQDSSRIYFSKSTNGGTGFTNGMRINQFAGDCLYLDITDPHPFVGTNGEVYVTFMDSAGIRLNKSLDYGNTWLPAQPLIDAGGVYRYYNVPGVQRIRSMPYAACDRSNSAWHGNLYVSWTDQRNGINNTDVFFVKSSDGGASWSPAVKVNTDNSNHHQYRNAMAVDETNGYIYIVYYDRRNYNNDSTDVYMSKSVNGGASWTDYKISNTGFFSDGSSFDGDYIDISAHNGIVRPIWTRIDLNYSSIWTCLYNETTTGISSYNNIKKILNFTVNPNPADVVATISFSDEVEDLQGNIIDASGRNILSFSIHHQREKTIDLSNIPSGIYFVKAGMQTKKLVIEK